MYELTAEQMDSLVDYFVRSTTATSNDEIGALLALDEAMLVMLREILDEQS